LLPLSSTDNVRKCSIAVDVDGLPSASSLLALSGA
jgi:hypothetical protein